MKFKLKQEGLNASIQFIVSFIFVLMGVWFYFDKLKNKPEIDVFDWAYILFFGILFLVFLIKGIIGIIKYPFLQIDDEKITYLPDVNDFPTVLEWENIIQVEINEVVILLHKKAGQPLHIYLDELNDKIVKSDFINMVEEFTEKKKIPIIK